MSTATDERPPLNDQAVEEIRVWMVRRRMNQTRMAKRLGVSQVWVSRRIGIRVEVPLTLDELERFADALGVAPVDLLPRMDSPGATSTGGYFSDSRPIVGLHTADLYEPAA